MFDVKVKGTSGYVHSSILSDVIEKMGRILSEEFAERDARIARLERELETERRLRLAMKR